MAFATPSPSDHARSRRGSPGGPARRLGPLQRRRKACADRAETPILSRRGPSRVPAGPPGQPRRLLASAALFLALALPLGAQTDVTHELDLTAVILRGSNWNRNRVDDHLERTARIFAACGIGLGKVTVLERDGPGGRHDIDFATPVPGSEIPQDVYDFTSALPPETDWPVVVFAGRLEGVDDLARSFQQGAVPDADLPRYPYMNTAWIAYKTHWIDRREDEYSTSAHELGHLLCRCGHESGDEPHLLHRFRNFLGAPVLPRHCEAFRRSPLVRPVSPR